MDSVRNLSPELADLIRLNIGLARAVASKFCRGRVRVEDSDAYSIACLALIDAAETFDPTKAKFSTWATRIITQKIISDLRKNRKRQIEVNFSSIDKVEDQADSRTERHIFPECLVDVFTTPSSEDSKLDLENKHMLRMHFIEKKSLSEIGKEFGMTKENVRLRTLKAISSIRSKNKQIIDQYAL